MKPARLILGALLAGAACVGLTAQAQPKRAAPPGRAAPAATASVKIVNNFGAAVRVRLVGYDFASREPIDIPNGLGVSISRLAAGEYVLVVHSRESREVVPGPAKPIKITSNRLGSDEQTIFTMTKGDDGKYDLKKSVAPLAQPKYSKFNQQN